LIQRNADRAKLLTWLTTQGFRSTAARLGLNGSLPSNVEATAEPQPTAQGNFGLAAPLAEVGFGPYESVTSVDALRGWIAEATSAGRIAIDTQTNGLDAMRARLVGFSLATTAGRGCYVPLAHEVLGDQIKLDIAIEVLGPLLTDPSVLKIFQDAKFDMMALLQAGFPIATPVDDTMLISYTQEAGMHGHSLDDLSQLHLGHTPTTYNEVTGTGRNRVSFAQVQIDRATGYAAEDADVTIRLWDTLRPRLRLNGGLTLYEQLERRLIPILLNMERAGIKVDANDLRRMSIDFEARMTVIEQHCHRLAGYPFNVGSPKQLGEVLFDDHKLPGGKRMKTGAWGTDSAVLQGLAEQGHELPSRILEWRQLQKLKSTYADSLVNDINPTTGRVHTCFAMAIASTGRLSSTDPNLQNIPIRTEEGSLIRHAFIADPGHLLVSADYSQIELRLLAHVADLSVLRDSFANGEDIHARTAAEVFGVPMVGMDPMTRRRAKAINFGIIYGISSFGLARQLGISPGEARGYIDRYFERYPGIRVYMERTKQQARSSGYVLSPFGRRCWVPGIADRNAARRAYAERQAINAPLQGGAADVIKRAMVQIPSALKGKSLRSKLLLQVHDELLFEAPAEEAETLAKLVKQVMENAVTLSVPLVVETGIGRTWAEAH
jgi:DNA polymerase-1